MADPTEPFASGADDVQDEAPAGAEPDEGSPGLMDAAKLAVAAATAKSRLKKGSDDPGSQW
jgi:hypothetical protein